MSVRAAGTCGSRPSTRTSPWLGGSAVASSRSRVVLPAPFGPSKPITPGSRSRSTSARARVAPNVRPTPRRLIEAVIAATSRVEVGAGGAGVPEEFRTTPRPASGRPPGSGPGARRPAKPTAWPPARPSGARRRSRCHGQEEPEPASVPNRRRESGEREDRGHADQPRTAERAGHRDQPGLVGRDPGGAQQPLERRRAWYLDGVACAVPHRGEIDHGDVDRAGRGVQPGPAPRAGQHVLLDRGALAHRLGPLDVTPQCFVVDMPAGHDSPSASVARKRALARYSRVFTLLTGRCSNCAASFADRPSSTTSWMTARISGDSRARASPMSPYSTDNRT